MSDFITITGLEVTTCHGVLASEKVEPQRFIADISFDIDLRRAGESDDLTRSVSYADVAQAAEAICAPRRSTSSRPSPNASPRRPWGFRASSG